VHGLFKVGRRRNRGGATVIHEPEPTTAHPVLPARSIDNGLVAADDDTAAFDTNGHAADQFASNLQRDGGAASDDEQVEHEDATVTAPVLK
jgi:hypothetical protein